MVTRRCIRRTCRSDRSAAGPKRRKTTATPAAFGYGYRVFMSRATNPINYWLIGVRALGIELGQSCKSGEAARTEGEVGGGGAGVLVMVYGVCRCCFVRQKWRGESWMTDPRRNTYRRHRAQRACTSCQRALVRSTKLASNPENRCSVLLFLTAIASAFRWPMNVTSFLPRVTPV